MLDRLRGGEHRGVEDLLVGHLAHDLLSLVQDAVHRGAVHALDLLAVHLEDLLQALHLSLGLAQVCLERLLELGRARLLDHLRQRLQDLVLGVVDVLQRVDEQVVHGLDVLGEHAHRFLLLAWPVHERRLPRRVVGAQRPSGRVP